MSAPLFFFGTLRWPDLLNTVLGREAQLSEALLPGWQAMRAEGGDFPILVPNPDGTAKGLLLEDVTQEDLARLNHYEGGFGYTLAPRQVQRSGQDIEARVFVADSVTASSDVWSLEAWRSEWGEMTLRAAPEIMRAYDSGEDAQSLAHRFPMIWARAASVVANQRHERPHTVGERRPAEAITITRQERVYERFFSVEEMRFQHPRFDGQMQTVDRAVFNVCNAATVLPYDPKRDRVLLVEQVRAGAIAAGDPLPWLLEPVAGMIDAGEAPLTAAVREAEEEAGLVIAPAACHLAGRYYASPGGLTQIFYSYVGCTDLPDSAAKLGGAAEEGEDILGHLVAFETLMAMLESGEASNAPLILSAQWLALHRDRLRG